MFQAVRRLERTCPAARSVAAVVVEAVEVVVQSVAELRAAVAGGADRVELCVGLAAGGVTPPVGLVGEAVAVAGDVPVHVLVRCRPGDFVFTAAEVDVMAADIGAARDVGARGVVVGALTPDGDVDVAACRRMIDASGPLSVTFHRAFDEASDPFAALDAIVTLGCDRVLTSGQASTAPEGTALLRRLVEHAGDRITILAGGGVRAGNVASMVARSGVREVHFSLAGAGRVDEVVAAARSL